MSSVSGTSTSLSSSLLQTLQAIDPAAVSNPAVVAALQKAPASDIVKLSDAALQLQSVDALFGSTDSSATSSDPFAALLGGSSSVADPTGSSSSLLDSIYGASAASSGANPFGSLTPSSGSTTSPTTPLSILA